MNAEGVGRICLSASQRDSNREPLSGFLLNLV